MKVIIIFSVLGLFLGQCNGDQYDQCGDETSVVKIMNSNYNKSCTGTLIHPQWVLTSAVCAYQTFIQETRVFFSNVHDYNSADFIQNTYIHPGFDAEERENDIALLELEDPADKTIRILKIPKEYSNLVAKKARVLKWGNFNSEDEPVTVYKETNNSNTYYDYVYCDKVVIINNNLCQYYPVYVSSQRLCTYDSIACEGDEGAPLITNEDNNFVGLVSVSAAQAAICDPNNCIMPVTTYTATVPYRSWIQEITGLNIL